MPSTVSEELFEKYCQKNGLAATKIIERYSHRRPDYKVRSPEGQKAIVEVKEITRNEEDIRREKELSLRNFYITTDKPGRRVASCLRSTSGQLKKFSKRKIPTLVIIFDTTNSVHYTDPDNVKAGMFGLDAVILSVPQNITKSSFISGVKSGGDQTLSHAQNTSISAVGILRKIGEEIDLYVYHNHFARIPFEEKLLTPFVTHQYKMEIPNGRHLPGWIKVG